MPRGTQITRQWRIIRFMLNFPEGLTAFVFVKVLRVRQQTIYRDLEQLAEVFPIFHEPGERREPGVWYLKPSAMGEMERDFLGNNGRADEG